MISDLFSPSVILFVIALCVTYAIGCRLRHMDASTWWVVRWQHCLLAAGAIFSVVVPAEWSGVPLGLGLVLFLAFSAPRWRNGLPGTMARPPKVHRDHWLGGR